MKTGGNLQVEDLRCLLGGKLVLDDVSFVVDEGEFLAVVGPNGAGKSTLLKCLMKIVRFDQGSVLLNGEDLSGMGQKVLARYAAYVPQGDARYLPFTAEEFVMTGRYPHISPFTTYSKEDRTAVLDAIDMTGIGDLARRRMSALSGGERQLVMIASALAQGAGIMFLDEPAAFLDPGHELDVMRLLTRINRELGTTIIMVTHDMNRAILSSGRSLVLNSGRVEYFGESAGLMPSRVLERIYGREFRYIRHPDTDCDIILPEVIEHDC